MIAPYYDQAGVTIYHGDCVAVMASMDEASVDAVVTDPPYGLRFMGKAWDGEDIERRARTQSSKRPRTDGGNGDESPAGSAGTYDLSRNAAFQAWCGEWSREVLRVLKPGGHIVAFGGTRTFHRLTCALEDAGFEIRDCLMWCYGAGFPKSHNIDNLRGKQFCGCSEVESRHADGRVCNVPEADTQAAVAPQAEQERVLHLQVQEPDVRGSVQEDRAQGACGVDGCEPAQRKREDDRPPEPGMEGRRDDAPGEGQLPGSGVRPSAGVGEAYGAQGRVHHGASPCDSEVGGSPTEPHGGCEPPKSQPEGQPPRELGALADERGSQARGVWPVCGRCGKPRIPRGLGTALKPAWEPCILARKPLIGTVAANVQEHGTGALNVDGCRIEGAKPDTTRGAGGQHGRLSPINGQGRIEDDGKGRWPANVVLDEEAARLLDEQSGESKDGEAVEPSGPRPQRVTVTPGEYLNRRLGYGGSGGASRFFYCAKASRAERGEGNNHPTVKPVDLMRWLCRLITPPGRLILDPFLGSGTTGVAARLEGFQFVGIEREADYLEIARRRILNAWAHVQRDPGKPKIEDAPGQMELFGGEA